MENFYTLVGCPVPNKTVHTIEFGKIIQSRKRKFGEDNPYPHVDWIMTIPEVVLKLMEDEKGHSYIMLTDINDAPIEEMPFFRGYENGFYLPKNKAYEKNETCMRLRCAADHAQLKKQ